MSSAAKIILGIDPGTNILGYGVVAITPIGLQLLKMDVVHMNSKMDAYQKLAHIYERISHVITLYRPTDCAIEAPFFGKNVQSMLKLGRAQGVAIAAMIGAGLQVHEYSPKKIKQSVTGNGNASKEQVAKMVGHILEVKDMAKYYDATDAVAVALCHHLQGAHDILHTKPASNKASKKSGGWAQFVNSNPTKVVKPR